MKHTVTATPLEEVKADALVVIHEPGGVLGASENPALAGHFAAFERAVEKKRSRRSWFCTLALDTGVATEHLLLESTTFDNKAPHDEPLKQAIARAVALCREHSLRKIAIAAHHDLAPAKAAIMLEGALLGDFVDTRFKGDPDKNERPDLELAFVVPPGAVDATREALARTAIICEAQNHARELVNAPHNILTPAALAEYAVQLAKRLKLECEVLDEKQLRKQGYEMTWQVGRGSEYPPRMIVIRYKPKKPALPQHFALVGKGMTFDSGGYSIKTRATMPLMNYDMAGSAAVLGAIEALVRLKFPARITVVICSAHNAVDGAAYQPGAIIRAKNGKTVFIENTDAEGRLILTDGFARAGEEGADVIVDLATLTGAVVQALGSGMAGVFTEDEQLGQLLSEAGQTSGERTWGLPLVREYDHLLHHALADLSNMASVETGSAIHAANFLRQFVPTGARWAHIDIAGVAYAKTAHRYFAKGATGYGVRLLVEAMRLALEGQWPERELKNTRRTRMKDEG